MPELRKDPITGRWVIIATERAQRPGDFAREQVRPSGDRFCPFCPGHEEKTPPEVLSFRTHGSRNEPGWSLRAIPNKFPALRVEGELDREAEGLYDRMNGVGAHEVIIESPDHLQTLATMDVKRVEDLFWAFRERVLDLKKDFRLRYILLFKNHGSSAGASLEHTHSQLIALPVVPKQAIEEIEGARRHYEHRDRCVYCDILRQERRSGERTVAEDDHFLAATPYASRFPFETWVLPKRHHSHCETIAPDAAAALARIFQGVLQRLDRALEHPAYNFVVHTAPVQEEALAHYHWHIEIIPRLTRTAGFEWGSGFYINPTPPEQAAKFLRES